MITARAGARGGAALGVLSWLLAGAVGGCGASDAARTGAPASTDGGAQDVDGGYTYGGMTIPADRFATRVVSFTPGGCAGFGQSSMPGIVLGPPRGGGTDTGSVDVVSLGARGSIVLGFETNPIVDGPGVDFLVFENPFDIGGDPKQPNAEPGEVSVSEDGTTWSTFPCSATSFPYGACAGWHPVLSSPENQVSPIDPQAAGGDPFDLADLGGSAPKRVRYVRIVDKGREPCVPGSGDRAHGFDLDAISVIHGSK